MAALRGVAVVVSMVTVMVGGCSTQSASDSDPSTASSQSAPSPPSRFDVSAIAKMRDAMPPGFIPTYPSGVTKLTPPLAANVGSVVSYGQPFIVEPAGCRPLLQQVRASAGAQSQRARGDEVDKRTISIGAVAPVDVPDPIPSVGCDRMTYDVDEAEYPLRGTVERLRTPAIDGAVTIALRNVVEGYPNVEYSYAAIVDGGLYVDVDARLAPDFPAEAVLGDLLVKAVAAVRGQ